MLRSITLACLLSAATALVLNGPVPKAAAAGQRASRVVMMGKKAKGAKVGQRLEPRWSDPLERSIRESCARGFA